MLAARARREVGDRGVGAGARPHMQARRRDRWLAAEEADLRAGVAKHGKGRWRRILNDPAYSFKNSRTNVDLKDKWRNESKEK